MSDSTMRALVCSRLEGLPALAIGDLPRPDMEPGSARVRIRAAGVNFPDLLVIQGKYQDQPPLPFAPGIEMAGEVTEVAPDVDGVAVGDQVFGFISHGGYAEETVVAASRLFPVPPDMGTETAAAFPIAYGTSYHALVDRARLASGEGLLVLGAGGGVGLAAVQIGKTLGARVIAAVSSEEKAKAAEAAGASDIIRYDSEDLRQRLRAVSPGGVDVVYDPVGGDVTEIALRATAWGGRHLIVGFAAGSIPTIPANLTLLKGSSVVGVFWGRFTETQPEASRANFETLTDWWSQGRIDPVVSETFPLDRATEALERIGSRGAIGKLVVTP